jgi:hypothetical protein
MVGCNTITPETLVWRITDTEGGAIYFARSFGAQIDSNSTFNHVSVVNTFTLSSQADITTPIHVDSESAWKIPLDLGGQPQAIEGHGYAFVRFRDIQTGQKLKIVKFSADTVKASAILDRSQNSP